VTPSENAQHEAEKLLDRVEIRYGRSSNIRRRLVPIVARILETGGEGPERADLLRSAIAAYATHMRAQEKLGYLKDRLRDRLNVVYGQLLGIEPPRVG
jgi:hypothetical protein